MNLERLAPQLVDLRSFSEDVANPDAMNELLPPEPLLPLEDLGAELG